MKPSLDDCRVEGVSDSGWTGSAEVTAGWMSQNVQRVLSRIFKVNNQSRLNTH